MFTFTMDSYRSHRPSFWKYSTSVLIGFLFNTFGPIGCVSDKFLWKANSEVVIQGVGNGVEWFTRNETRPNHYRILLVKDDNLLLAARNYFYNISMISLQENMHSKWDASRSAVAECLMKDKSEELCQNYIRVIALNNSNLFVCGTNAFKPICRSYEIKRGSYVRRRYQNGVAYCPFDPNHNSTALLVDNKLFAATVADTSGRDPLIFRAMIRTEQHDSRWLNEPDFVSSFDYEDKVYFVFREAAVENINCGKAVFSRIARVCKNDEGGKRSLVGTWTSFYKARLNCSIPGEFPFYFNEVVHSTGVIKGNHISSVDKHAASDIFYAIFNTPDNSVPASAVCAFSMGDVNKTFKSRFKGQKTALHNWLAVHEKDTPKPHPEGCQPNSKMIPDQTLNFIKSHPLMNDAVPSLGHQPILVNGGFNYRFTRIAVHEQYLAVDGRYYDILFIGTNEGHVLKVVNIEQNGKMRSIVIEELLVFKDKSTIVGLQVYHKFGLEKLIVVSSEDVVSIPLHRCHLKVTCRECVALQDPYCSWLDGKCSAFSSRGEISRIQNIRVGIHAMCEEEEMNATKAISTSASTRPTSPQETTVNTTMPQAPNNQKPLPSCQLCTPCSCPEDAWKATGPTSVPTPPSNDPKHGLSQDNVASAQTIPTSIFIGSLVLVFLFAGVLGFIIGFKVSTCRTPGECDSPLDDPKANLHHHHHHHHHRQDSDHYYAKPDNIVPTKYNNVWDCNPRGNKVPNTSADFRSVNNYTNVRGKTYL